MEGLTPIQPCRGDLFKNFGKPKNSDRGWFLHLKRDDLFCIAGVNGGKARTCLHLATTPDVPIGLVTASARNSPQANIVARVAKHLGISCRVHMPSGVLGQQGELAVAAGAEIIQHKPGYNTVIVKRARDDALRLGWRNIPFGMECKEAVQQTAKQVESYFYTMYRRIVVPVGSGMSLAGILWGLRNTQQRVAVVGVYVGADPTKRLDRYAPMGWRLDARLEKSPFDYNTHLENMWAGDVFLDPVYEAKCVEYLQSGDLFWIVGSRNLWAGPQ